MNEVNRKCVCCGADESNFQKGSLAGGVTGMYGETIPSYFCGDHEDNGIEALKCMKCGYLMLFANIL